jgi:hypothetical protein
MGMKWCGNRHATFQMQMCRVKAVAACDWSRLKQPMRFTFWGRCAAACECWLVAVEPARGGGAGVQ